MKKFMFVVIVGLIGQAAYAADAYRVSDVVKFVDGKNYFEGTEKYGFAFLMKRPCNVTIYPNGKIDILSPGSNTGIRFVPNEAEMEIDEDSLEANSVEIRTARNGNSRDFLQISKNDDTFDFKIRSRLSFGGGLMSNIKGRCKDAR